MNIDKGELFVVTRGFEFGRGSDMLLSIFSGYDGWLKPPKKPEEKQYDRSDEGLVFRALEVCGDMIAAEVVAVSHSARWKKDRLGKRYSINTREVEVWPVTYQYLAALTPSQEKADGN